KPFVTVSYAQGLDGSISAQDKTPLQISCHETLVMTHGLRHMHDAILIGAGTTRRDNPRY
ncbi:unnamed protein product, partial [Chrysoparadoxa australica]